MDKCDEVLALFSHFHEKLQFTMEMECNMRIPFLDMRIERDLEGDLSTDWYKKPIASGRKLNFHSCHHMSQRLGTAVGFTKRVFGLGNKVKNMSDHF